MLGILAIVCFIIAALCAWGLAALNPLGLIALGLALFAAHGVYPWTPWRRGA